jgi:putative ABC transport system permease protein
MSASLRRAWQRLLSLFRRRRLEAELDEELRAHLEMAIDDNLARGMTPAEARRRALVAFGGIEQARELHREARGLPTLESIGQDVRYAVRTLRRSPGFTLVAVTILALGIGANTAVFSLVDAVLLRPLPFPEPDRLALLWVDFSARGGPARAESTPADFAAWRERSQSFDALAGFVTATYNLTGSGEPEKLTGVRTTANLFEVLGLRPLVGRALGTADDASEAGPVVVVGERLWRSRFGGDAELVGPASSRPRRSLVLNGLAHTVVGVVPHDFQFPRPDIAVWVPARFTPDELAQLNTYTMNVVGRLRAGVGIGEAQAEMNAIARRLGEERSGEVTDLGVTVAAVHEHLTRGVRPALFLLIGAVGLILLITCANIANLLLVRGAGRGRELALRRAIGAGRGRVVRQLLTESAVLAGLGVTAGAALSWVSFAYLARLVPSGLPTGRPDLDLRVLAFAAAVAVLAVLAAGTGPALVAARGGLSATLRSGGRATLAGGRRVRHALVVAELTLTCVLLVGAGLLVRSYANVLAVDPGFEPGNLLVAETILPPAQYASEESRLRFFEGVLERVAALPGVVAAGYVNAAPLVLKGGRALVAIEGRPEPSREEFMRHIVCDRVVTAGYLQALGVPLVRGRYLDERDAREAPLAAVVNRAMADVHWPHQDPLGARIKLGLGSSADPWFTVVGVVDNVRQMGLEAAPEAEVFLPAAQVASERPFLWPQYLVARTEGDPLALAAAVRAAVWEVDPGQPVADVRSMDQVLDGELAGRDVQLTLVGGFALLALLMAAVGLYGVLAYTVTQRAGEIGVRIALGAQRAGEVARVVRGALLLAALGLAPGLLGALVLTRFLRSLLFAVEPTDPATFAAAAAVVLSVAALASWVPARRAARVDPVTVLRAE